MPTFVIDWEWSTPFSLVNIPSTYSQALILVRCLSAPVEQIKLPIHDGRLSAASIEIALSSNADLFREQIAFECQIGQGVDPLWTPLPSATVAVCTRDRTEDLERCIEGILRLRGADYEVLIVDNCPSDQRTADLVKKYRNIKYVCEPTAGLNHARNRALREASGDVVVFIDDDAVPDQFWLEAHLRNYDQPIVQCVTGLTVALELEHASQEEFEEYSSFARGFQRIVFDSAHHDPLAPGGIGAGVNMSLRRTIADEVGAFDGALDAGTPTKSGGDHEMFSRILCAGYRIIYEPRAINRHRHRNSPFELEKAIEGYGTGAYAAMTRALLVHKELGSVRIAWLWFRHQQARALLRALLGRGTHKERRLIWAEVRGCLRGPFAYLRSVRAIKHQKLKRYG